MSRLLAVDGVTQSIAAVLRRSPCRRGGRRVTLNCWPDTLNDAASAPCARATPIAAVAATLGTMTTANRFHLVPPRTWDSIFPPSRTYISGPGCPRSAAQPGRDGRSATSSGRRAPVARRREPRTDHRRSPPSDNHWSRLTRITHNLLDRLRRAAKTPLSKSRRRCRRPLLGGDPRPRDPTGCRAYGNGPSVADRGAFAAARTRGSLLASNGRITEPRPGGSRAATQGGSQGRTKLLIIWTEPDRPTPADLLASNSGRDYQDLVKRGRLCHSSANLSLGQHRPGV